MKKIVTLFSIFFLALTPALSIAQQTERAQTKENIEAQAEEQTQELTESLELDQNQIPLVKKRLTSFLTAKNEVESLNMEAEDESRRMEALKSNHITIMGQILNDAQRKDYLNLQGGI